MSTDTPTPTPALERVELPVEQRILVEAFKLRYGDKGHYEATALIGFLEAAGLALVSRSPAPPGSAVGEEEDVSKAIAWCHNMAKLRMRDVRNTDPFERMWETRVAELLRALSARAETARATALEEAAKVADRCYINSTWPSTVRVDVDGQSIGIAEAIRSLTAPAVEKE